MAAVPRESGEDERRRAAYEEEDEEAAYQARMADAMSLSAAGDCVVPPLRPVPNRIERYSWNGEVREWVSAPPVWLEATPAQEQLYLQ